MAKKGLYQYRVTTLSGKQKIGSYIATSAADAKLQAQFDAGELLPSQMLAVKIDTITYPKKSKKKKKKSKKSSSFKVGSGILGVFTAKSGSKFTKTFNSVASWRRAKRGWMSKGGSMPWLGNKSNRMLRNSLK